MSVIPELPEAKGDAGKVLRWVNTLLISGGALVAVAFWNDWRDGQKEVKASLGVWHTEMRESRDELKESINQLKMDSVTNSADRFRSTDWTKAKDSLDTRFNSQDARAAMLERRVDKVEDALPQIKDSLKRVEASLGSNPKGDGE